MSFWLLFGRVDDKYTWPKVEYYRKDFITQRGSMYGIVTHCSFQEIVVMSRMAVLQLSTTLVSFTKNHCWGVCTDIASYNPLLSRLSRDDPDVQNQNNRFLSVK